MKLYRFTINLEDIGKRLDRYLAENLPDYSRNYIQNLIKEGRVTINEKPAKANYRIKQGDLIAVEIPPARELELIPENIDIDIIYQDKDIAIINKPQGMVVHPAAGNYSGTLVNALLYHCDSLSGINGKIRPGIVHRLDKDTSGLLVIAKNDFAHNYLSHQLQERKITRIYHAIAEGVIGDDEGTIRAPIGRSLRDRKKMAVVTGGRSSITHYRVLERFAQHTYLELTLETGRTHQIRVHLKYLGHPLVGDPVYGRRKQVFNLRGQALHAYSLILTHPTTGERMSFIAPLPGYFENLLKTLRQREKNN